MPTILEELYYGTIRPDSKHYSPDSQFVKLAKLKDINLNKLTKLLTEDENELLEKYLDAEAEMAHIVRYSSFTYGFKLGALLMIETFMGKDEIVQAEMI